jgi:hypothetical protein
MMDTMGQAAKMTGGYGNSYAQMAGQQAYQGYLQGLNDKVPELYQLALDRYNQQGQDLLSKYGLLNTQEQQAYDRYLNDYNLWNTDRAFDYGAYRDAVSDDQWQTSFDEDLRRWNFANKQGEYAVAPAVYSGSGGDEYRNPNPGSPSIDLSRVYEGWDRAFEKAPAAVSQVSGIAKAGSTQQKIKNAANSVLRTLKK